MTCYIKNIEVIKKKYLYVEKNMKNQDTDKSINLQQTKDGNYTILVDREEKFYLHSKYRPYKEAEKFSVENLKNSKKIIFLYGFGMGYHVECLLKKMEKNQKLIIFENNISVFKKAIESRALEDVFEDERVTLIIENNQVLMGKELKKQMLKYEENYSFILHMPSVKAIEEKNYDLRFAFENMNILRTASDKYRDEMYENYMHNKKHIKDNVGKYFGKFKNVPAIVIGAGPSLDGDKKQLKNLKNEALIFTCGTALKPLLREGVKPDLFMIIDPDKSTYNQISEVENVDVPAIFLATTSSYTVSKFEGEKMIAYQGGYIDGDKNFPIESGGSVVTSIIDICIKMGCNPIVLMGVDLAYTNDKHHAADTEHGEDINVKVLKNMRKVKSNTGEMVRTTLGMISFKRFIEAKIEKYPNLDFYNTSQIGALIEGTKNIKAEDIKKITKNKKYNIKEILNK